MIKQTALSIVLSVCTLTVAMASTHVFGESRTEPLNDNSDALIYKSEKSKAAANNDDSIKQSDMSPPKVADFSDDDADFYLNMKSCKTVVGYLVLSTESLKGVVGEPFIAACRRTSKTYLCWFPDGDADQKQTYLFHITLDSPPLLSLDHNDGADFILINTVEHAATFITRVVDRTFAGSKVCQGMYVTSQELQASMRQKSLRQ